MAKTYEAYDALFDKIVAVKIVDAQKWRHFDSLRESFMLLSGFSHLHVAELHDVGYADDGAFYLTMDYVDGVTLDDYARKHGWQISRKALVCALQGLHFLHQRGVRHGDFKPKNIVVSDDGQVSLIDFDCCQPLCQTTLAELSGTPAFIAPELRRGYADQRSDVYAAGKTLARIAELTEGFPGEELSELIHSLTHEAIDSRSPNLIDAIESLGGNAYSGNIAAGALQTIIGRQSQLDHFTNVLEHLCSSTPGTRVFYVWGPPGSGRTRLLQQYKWLAQQKTLFIEGNSRHQDGFYRLWERVCQLSRPRDHYESIHVDSNRLSVAQLIDGLGALERHRPVVVMIDDVQQLDAEQRHLLDAFIHTMDEQSPLLFVCSDTRRPEIQAEFMIDVEVRAIPFDSFSAAVDGQISPSQAKRIYDRAQGNAAMLTALMSNADRPTSVLEREARFSPAFLFEDADGRELDDNAQKFLAQLCVSDGLLADAVARGLDPDRRVRQMLCQDGIVHCCLDGWRLQAHWSIAAVRRLVGERRVDMLHETTADALLQQNEWLESGVKRNAADVTTACSIVNRVIWHLSQAKRYQQAEAILLANKALMIQHPLIVFTTIAALSKNTQSISGSLVCCDILTRCGEAHQTVSVLATWLRRFPTYRSSFSFCLEAGKAYMQSGSLKLSVRWLTRAWRCENKPDDYGQAAHMLSLALIKLGRYVDAKSIADQALFQQKASRFHDDLCVDQALAVSYLGQIDDARKKLDDVFVSGKTETSPLTMFRLLSAKGLLETRSDDHRSAQESYAQALAISERYGIAEHLARALLNLGVAEHQLGHWGQALRCYERGIRMARALRITNTEVILISNLARILLEVGSFDAAYRRAQASCRLSEEAGMVFMNAVSKALTGEIEWIKGGDIAKAIELIDTAYRAFSQQNAEKEAFEAKLLLLEVQLFADGGNDVIVEFATFADEIKRRAYTDLYTRSQMAFARYYLREKNSEQVQHYLRIVQILAAQQKKPLLSAELETLHFEVARAEHNFHDALRQQNIASSSWAEIAASLPESLRSVFWNHPRRRALSIPIAETLNAAVEHLSDEEQMSDRWRRLAALNKRINSALDTQEVLRAAMEASIELTHAERGFLLVGIEQPEIAIATRIDKTMIGQAHLKISHSIAKEVLKTGEPVMTVDALTDERFVTSQSVHALKLKSILCVPIHSPSGVMGAIYLDSQVAHRRFSNQDYDILSAMADQVAIALSNAELHAQLKQYARSLERKSQQLDDEKKRVAQLLDQKTIEAGRLSQQIERGRSKKHLRERYPHIVGSSAAIECVFSLLDRVVETNVDVLVRGESGTGKELVARAIHDASLRRDAPFIAVNCGALPDNLLESELFGYRKGSFTGAVRDSPGLIRAAQGGTLFLDEFGEMSLSMQVKLLRVFQERTVLSLGAQQSIDVDVRFVFATNRNLVEDVREGRFREDLYYRSSVIEIVLPPLRDRIEDVAEIVAVVLDRIASQYGRERISLTRQALHKLMNHQWPGNVRELENVLRRAALLTTSDVIDAKDIEWGALSVAAPGSSTTVIPEGLSEKQKIERMLMHCDWKVVEAARRLGMPRATLYRKMKRYGLKRIS